MQGTGSETEEYASVDNTPQAEPVAQVLEGDNHDSSKESVHDTVARAWDMHEQGLMDEPEEAAANGDKVVQSATPVPSAAQPEAQTPVDIEPPASFTAAEKEAFMKVPNNIKPAIKRRIAEMETKFHAANRHVKAIQQEASSVINAVRPFIPIWAKSGHTVESAVSKLCALYHEIENDPETAIKNIAEMKGVNLRNFIAQKQASRVKDEVDFSEHPQFKDLTNKLNAVMSRNEQLEHLVVHRPQAAQQAQYEAQARQEIEAVQNELDQNGHYLYPELHDPESRDRLKPLVSAYRKTFPQDSFSDLTKRAIHTLRGNFSNGQTRLPVSNTNENLQRARAASVSVRGRGAAPQLSMSPKDVPDTAKATAAMVYEMLSQGR